MGSTSCRFRGGSRRATRQSLAMRRGLLFFDVSARSERAAVMVRAAMALALLVTLDATHEALRPRLCDHGAAETRRVLRDWLCLAVSLVLVAAAIERLSRARPEGWLLRSGLLHALAWVILVPSALLALVYVAFLLSPSF